MTMKGRRERMDPSRSIQLQGMAVDLLQDVGQDGRDRNTPTFFGISI